MHITNQDEFVGAVDEADLVEALHQAFQDDAITMTYNLHIHTSYSISSLKR